MTEIVDTFLETALKVGAGATLVNNMEELNSAVAGLLENAASVYLVPTTENEAALDLPEDRRSQDYLTADAGLEEVFAGVAETGSIVCSSATGKALQAGLVPPHHVAILSKENIFEDLDAFFASCGDERPTNLTLITGPSRTADIELTLTVGVHGPERLDIVVI